MISVNVIKALMVTADIFGKRLTEESARMLAEDLSIYSEPQILNALGKCRRELRTFPTPSDIITRLDDGRPGAEEAWALIPKDEASSVVWTDEMAAAFNVARGLIDEDEIAARMAFKESYLRQVADARAQNRKVNWTISLGHDLHGRDAALTEAIQKNRISYQEASALLPDYSSRTQGLKPVSLTALLTSIPKETVKA